MATSIFREYFKGYEILGEIGRGNARVLKARHLVSDNLVAIKHFAFNTDADTLRRFQRESEIMKSIQHDHIVKIVDVHLDAELPYIVMQLIEGGDVRRLMKERGTLEVDTVIQLAQHMTDALDAIHAKGVVHRDIKPENIMYRRMTNGELHFLLTDFGIAKLREQTNTVTGSSMLTYEYASPEQFSHAKTVSTPTDYYSLGIVLYECLTGSVPFAYNDEDLLWHINRVIESPVPDPELPEDRFLPPSLLQLLHGLLTKQAIYRLNDSAQVRQLLQQAAV
jgi:serine/threonine protein kinase